jgi:hypothetical protein
MLLSVELWIGFTVKKILVYGMMVCENCGFIDIVIELRMNLVSMASYHLNLARWIIVNSCAAFMKTAVFIGLRDKTAFNVNVYLLYLASGLFHSWRKISFYLFITFCITCALDHIVWNCVTDLRKLSSCGKFVKLPTYELTLGGQFCYTCYTARWVVNKIKLVCYRLQFHDISCFHVMIAHNTFLLKVFNHLVVL